MNHGKFIISLDFELMWGVRDTKTIAGYGSNIAAVHKVIPGLLSLFEEFDIHATFATVGLLFFDNKEDLLQSLPQRIPNYLRQNLSPYNGYVQSIGDNEDADDYHYAGKLIRLIQQYKNHEIGSHTFSHYYCLEKGQTIDDFRADLEAAKKTAAKSGITITSLVFPRNQFNDAYLEVCRQMGIFCYRGNETSWMYSAVNSETEKRSRRAGRLVDTYLNISGHHCYSDEQMAKQTPMDIPASRFLRPYSPRLNFADGLRLKRITTSMTHAAKNNLTYHLWWHPHNFGNHRDENIDFLRKILKRYRVLNSHFNFQSMTMSGLARKLSNVGV